MTNDNLPALYFYQRRGYYVTEWIPNGVAQHAKDASLPGFGGIPIRDEVRLEKDDQYVGRVWFCRPASST